MENGKTFVVVKKTIDQIISQSAKNNMEFLNCVFFEFVEKAKDFVRTIQTKVFNNLNKNMVKIGNTNTKIGRNLLIVDILRFTLSSEFTSIKYFILFSISIFNIFWQTSKNGRFKDLWISETKRTGVPLRLKYLFYVIRTFIFKLHCIPENLKKMHYYHLGASLFPA